MLVALHFVVSQDYEYFVHFLNGPGQTLYAIHLNDVYLHVSKVNGFAWDSKSVQYLLNVLNYSVLKHFASCFEVMMCVMCVMCVLCVQEQLMLKNQPNVLHDHCDELNDGVG